MHSWMHYVNSWTPLNCGSSPEGDPPTYRVELEATGMVRRALRVELAVFWFDFGRSSAEVTDHAATCNPGIRWRRLIFCPALRWTYSSWVVTEGARTRTRGSACQNRSVFIYRRTINKRWSRSGARYFFHRSAGGGGERGEEAKLFRSNSTESSVSFETFNGWASTNGNLTETAEKSVFRPAYLRTRSFKGCFLKYCLEKHLFGLQYSNLSRSLSLFFIGLFRVHSLSFVCNINLIYIHSVLPLTYYFFRGFLPRPKTRRSWGECGTMPHRNIFPTKYCVDL